jgi:hypothetical protein
MAEKSRATGTLRPVARAIGRARRPSQKVVTPAPTPVGGCRSGWLSSSRGLSTPKVQRQAAMHGEPGADQHESRVQPHHGGHQLAPGGLLISPFRLLLLITADEKRRIAFATPSIANRRVNPGCRCKLARAQNPLRMPPPWEKNAKGEGDYDPVLFPLATCGRRGALSASPLFVDLQRCVPRIRIVRDTWGYFRYAPPRPQGTRHGRHPCSASAQIFLRAVRSLGLLQEPLQAVAQNTQAQQKRNAERDAQSVGAFSQPQHWVMRGKRQVPSQTNLGVGTSSDPECKPVEGGRGVP